MRVTLYLTVEHGGATFRFGEADKTMRKIARLTGRATREAVAARGRVAAAETEDEIVAALSGTEVGDALEDEMADLLCEWFVEAVRGWTGLEHEDGSPLAFSHEAAQDMPFEVKVEVATAALAKRGEGLGGETRPAGPPTASMP